MNGIKIIADDLGLHQKVNEGIVLGLKNGWIGSASVMANGEAFNDSVERLKEIENPKIGVHLVLVEEKPLFDGKLIKSLVGEDGKFFKGHKIFFIRYILGLVKVRDIELEMRAQIDKLKEAGFKPYFLNSHQHLHLLPKVLNIVIKLAKEYDISYIRTVDEPVSGFNPVRIIQLCFLKFLSKKAKNKIRENNLRTNDFFIGFLHAGNLRRGDIKKAKKLSEKYIDKTIELGTHPGLENKELRMKYSAWGGYNWQRELDLLRNSNSKK